MVDLAVAGLLLYLAVVVAGLVLSVHLVYRITIKNIKPKCPIVNSEGHSDVYSGRMPRPFYEDMERYPWLFKKKPNRAERKKVRKKH